MTPPQRRVHALIWKLAPILLGLMLLDAFYLRPIGAVFGVPSGGG